MLRSIHITAGIFLVCSIILCSSSHASMDFTIKNGLNLGWYFHNDSTAYTVMECRSYAYYRDFDKDGKQDFMIELRQPLETIGDGGAKNPMGACKVRYFAINTATDGKAKTYAANRTAWRDLNPEWGHLCAERALLYRRGEYSLRRRQGAGLSGYHREWR